jgi:hypothetical protein
MQDEKQFLQCQLELHRAGCRRCHAEEWCRTEYCRVVEIGSRVRALQPVLRGEK